MRPRLTGVYIHLPYCDVKCAYCDFFSIARRHVDEDFWLRYRDRLLEDLREQFALLEADTPKPVLASVFFGGGTPSRAPAFVIEAVLNAIRRSFGSQTNAVEVSAEANPESLNDELTHAWLAAGVNRLSIGMQSRDAAVLKYLGRLYNEKAYATVLRRVRNLGFANINVDFITGVPGQSVRSTLQDLEFAVENGVTHISLYQLTIEPATLLKQRIESGMLQPPSDIRQVRQMDAAIQFLAQQGFARYEISNFARPGKTCRHNRLYWTGRPYLGLGVAAHMFTGKRRFFHERSLENYLRGQPPRHDSGAALRDDLINALRLKQRLPLTRILGCFAPALHARVLGEIQSAGEKGWLQKNKLWIALTDKGLKHTDSLLASLWQIAPD